MPHGLGPGRPRGWSSRASKRVVSSPSVPLLLLLLLLRHDVLRFILRGARRSTNPPVTLTALSPPCFLSARRQGELMGSVPGCRSHFRARRRTPITRLMTHDDAGELARDDLGPRLQGLRRSSGMTHAQLARSSGLSRRRVASIERGKTTLSAADISALADACGVDVDVLTQPEFRFVGTGGVVSVGGDELQGEAATDALLREYVSMVIELRAFRELSAAGLRQADLSELAHALGGTPAAIEARLIQLLGTDKEQAWRVRAAISPSLGPSL